MLFVFCTYSVPSGTGRDSHDKNDSTSTDIDNSANCHDAT